MAGNTEYITLVRRRRNPTRLRQWNATIGNGDDLKLAVTLYDQETDAAPLDVSAAAWKIAFWPDDRRNSWGGRSYDYNWPNSGAYPAGAYGTVAAYGVIVAGVPGRVNVLVPSATVATMLGRYRFAFQMQMQDGISSEMEGELTVLPSVGLAPISYAPFVLGVSILGGRDLLGGGGLDGDGFVIPLPLALAENPINTAAPIPLILDVSQLDRSQLA